MGNSTVGPNVTNWWEKQKEKLFPTNPWNRKPAWELTPTKNDILDFQRAQLSDKYGGDFSSWTPEGAFAYSYGQKTENKQNTDPGGGGGGSASSRGGPRRAAAARRAEELARQKQEAAQAAYDKNMGYLNEAYANRSNLLQQSYNDALAQLQASYDSGARGVNRNADSAQQQAYINYMMSKRDLPQALAAQGLTGGMSESALAGMYNSYGNNRNTIDRGRNESLAALLDTLNSNRSSALQSYNSQLSAAEQQKMAYQMQLEQALANGSAEILQNKYDTLQNLDNAYAQQILALQQAAERKAKMIQLGDAFIAFPGGTGTLEEITEVMSQVSLGQLSAPCILYDLDGYYCHLKALLAHMIASGLSSPERQRGIHFAQNLPEIQVLLS